MQTKQIKPVRGPLDHDVGVPGSKSLSNRVLLAAALAKGRSVLDNVLLAEDTGFLIEGLRRLGMDVQLDLDRGRVEVEGCAGRIGVESADIDCGESGTMLRLLTAVCASGHGQFRLHGRGRLPQRPMQPLLEALQAQGALLTCEQCPGSAPLTVHARGLPGGHVSVDAAQSSQFVSALLLAAPCASDTLTIEVCGDAVSRPYIDLTLDVMTAFGVQVATTRWPRIEVPAPQVYRATTMTVEPDASSAGYFFAAAAICGGRVRVAGLGRRSRQGDLRLADLLQQMGCTVDLGEDALEVRHDSPGDPLRAFQADFADMPDAVPTAAVLALFGDGASRMRGVAHLRHKESDRLAGLAAELQRLDATVVVDDDALTVSPPPKIRAATLKTYSDHRMAMALSLVGLAVPGIQIEDPACVGKSFPDFFLKLDQLTA